MQTIVDVHRAHIVEHDSEVSPSCRDLKRVPDASGVDGACRFCDFDNCTRSISLIGPLVIYVDLVGVIRVNLRWIFATNEDAAVGFLVDPELHFQFEILIGLLRDKKSVSGVGLNHALTQLPICVAYRIPDVQVCSVKQHRHLLRALCDTVK